MNRIAPAPAAASSQAWTKDAILALFALPLNDLMFQAQTALRENFDANAVQLSSLLSFKTGNCGEDCGYCAQSKRNKTALEPSDGLLSLEDVIAAAKRAKQTGAGRFCMSAAWRQLRNADLDAVAELVENVKALGLETCMTLGMVDEAQAQRLKAAGLDYYNHNIDTSPEYYDKVVTTRTFADRLETLAAVRKAGLKVCSGGIVGMGETRDDRAGMLEVLANLSPPPESVPINMLVPIPGTPMADRPAFDPLELVRTVAVARIVMPASYVRLSAGRKALSREAQAMCFLAGANSVFYGEKLLTTENAERDDDLSMFDDLGLRPEGRS